MSDSEAQGEQILHGYGQTKTKGFEQAFTGDITTGHKPQQTVPGQVCANPKCGVRVELIESASVTIGSGDDSITLHNKEVAICLSPKCGEIRTLSCRSTKDKKVFYGRHSVLLVSERSSLCRDGVVLYKTTTLPRSPRKGF